MKWAASLCVVALLGAVAGADEPSLQQLIAQASPGQTVHVPAGAYRGPVQIDKSITLIADGKVTIAGSGEGDVINVTAPRVTIRGFHICGSGASLDRENAGIAVHDADHTVIENNTLDDVLFGIYLRGSPHSVVRGNSVTGKPLDLGRRGDSIRLWCCPDSTIEANHVQGARDIIMWFSNQQTVRDNVISGCRYGLHFMYSDNDLLENNLCQDNSVGAYMMYSHNLALRNNRFLTNRGPSGYGIGLKSVDGIDATGNLFSGNRVGMYVDDSPSSVDVYHVFRHNAFLCNDIGIALLPNVQRTTWTENDFVDNFEQVAILGDGQLHDDGFSLNGRGNFWSDYRGYAKAGSDVGAFPYRSESLFENLMDRDPKLRLFMFSPAQQAVEFAAQAFPAFRPRVKLVDDHPIMRPATLLGRDSSGLLSWWLLLPLGILGMTALRPRRHAAPAPMLTEFPVANPPLLVTSDLGPTSDAPVLIVEHLAKRFGDLRAVDDLSFSALRGEALAIWGENGAGKTTAIKCVLGLYKSRGRIEICGQSLRKHSKAARRAVGYVPQELSLYDDMPLRGVLRFFAQLKRAATGRIEVVLAEVGLSSHAHKRVRELSGGMKQRLALAIALLADPPLLVLDEMTSSLDPAARRAFVALLKRQKQAGKTILFITHRLEEVETLADRVMILGRGRLKGFYPAAQLSAQLGLRARLKVMLDESSLNSAVAVLQNAGYAASRNGCGIYADIALNRKADPVLRLIQQGFIIEDFHIEEIEGSDLPIPEGGRDGIA